MFDINNQTVMIADSEYWNKDELKEIHDPRLEQAMNTSGFVEPPISVDDSTGGGHFWYKISTMVSLTLYTSNSTNI
nr:hypothetical protein [Liquorilactobacillus satsumensis]